MSKKKPAAPPPEPDHTNDKASPVVNIHLECPTHALKFKPGEGVLIRLTDRGGVVRGAYIGRDGVSYCVEWNDNGKHEQRYFYADELVKIGG